MSPGIIFMCGKHGGAFVEDEHDKAGQAYADERNVRHYRETGEYAGIDQQVEWILEGTEASRRRLTMVEYDAVRDARALLERHGFSVSDPVGVGVPRGETPQ